MAVFDHLGLSVSDYAQSKAFYDAAIAAGAADNGKPGIRTQYHPNNYGAFVLDRDGYNIEAVCHMPEWAAMLRDAILRIAPQHEVVFFCLTLRSGRSPRLEGCGLPKSSAGACC